MAGYGTDDAFTAWLAANGYSLPGGAASAAVLRQRGSTYIDGLYGPRFNGSPTGGLAQERAWPRIGACAYGNEVGAAVVPSMVVQASYHAAYAEAVSPGSLSVSGSEATRVKREKVEGAVEVEYQAADGEFSAASLTPILTAVEGLLAPFLMQPAPGILVV